MHPVDAACSRWEAAERSLVIAEKVFAGSVHLYLARGGPDPSGGAAAGLREARLQCVAALAEMHIKLEECRRAIPIL
jgi:hypothetical protein